MLNTRSIWILRFVLAVSLGLALANCNSTPRRVKPERSRDSVYATLDEVQAVVSAATAKDNLSSVLRMRTDANLFFAEAPGRLGPARSLLSFKDFSFLGDDAAIDAKTISGARVFLLDHARPDHGHEIGLIFGISTGQAFTYFAFKGEANISGDTLVGTLTRGNHAITITSRDVHNGILRGVIQLQVAYRGMTVGKIPTLKAY